MTVLSGAFGYMARAENLDGDTLDTLVNRRSGLLGLCGESDMREVQSLALAGNGAAQRAIEIYVYRIRRCSRCSAAIDMHDRVENRYGAPASTQSRVILRILTTPGRSFPSAGTGPKTNGTYLIDYRSPRGSGILPRFFQQSRLEGAPTRRYALSQRH